MCNELALEAEAQLAGSGQSGVCAIDHPAVTTKPLAALEATPCDAALDASLAQRPAAFGLVVALVHVDLVRSPFRLALQATIGLHCGEQVLEQH